MIKAVTKKEEYDALPADPYCAKITAFFDTYGSGYQFAMFWRQNENDAAICMVDGCLTVYAGENADYDELREFLKVIQYFSISCNEAVARKLNLNIDASSIIAKYTGAQRVDEAGILNDYDKKEIYSLLSDCGFEMGRYETFIADICSRINKSAAKISVIADEEGLCACAFALFIGRKSTLVGAVATRESKRNRGYAGRLVSALSQNDKNEVFLFCKNDGLFEFYKKLGFEKFGRWAEMKYDKERDQC